MTPRKMLNSNSSPTRRIRFDFDQNESIHNNVQKFNLDLRLTMYNLNETVIEEVTSLSPSHKTAKKKPIERIISWAKKLTRQTPIQASTTEKQQKATTQAFQLKQKDISQNFYNNLMQLKKDAAKQTIFELLAENVDVDSYEKSDYVDAVMAVFAHQLGLPTSDIQDTHHCDKKIVASLCHQFANRFSVETLLNYAISQLNLADSLTMEEFSQVQAKLDSYGRDPNFLQRSGFDLKQEQRKSLPETVLYMWHTLQFRTANYFNFELTSTRIQSTHETLFLPNEASQTSLKLAYVVKNSTAESTVPFIEYCAALLWNKQYVSFEKEILSLLSPSQQLELIKELFILLKQEAIYFDMAATEQPTAEEYEWLTDVTVFSQYIHSLRNDIDITPILDLAIYLPPQIPRHFCHSLEIRSFPTKPRPLSRYLFMVLMNDPSLELSIPDSPVLAAELIQTFSAHYAAIKTQRAQQEWIKKFLLIEKNPTFRALFKEGQLLGFIAKLQTELKALVKSLDINQKFPQSSGNLVAYILENHPEQSRLSKLREIARDKAELLNIIGDASQLLAILKMLPSHHFSQFFNELFPCYQSVISDANTLHTIFKELDTTRQQELVKALGHKFIKNMAGDNSFLLFFLGKRTIPENMHVKSLDFCLPDSRQYETITCNQRIIFYTVDKNQPNEMRIVDPQNVTASKRIDIEDKYQITHVVTNPNQNQLVMIMKDAKHKKYLRIYDATTHEILTEAFPLPNKTDAASCAPKVMFCDEKLFITTEKEIFLFNGQNKPWKSIPLKFNSPSVSCSFHSIGNKIAIIRDSADTKNKYLSICDANFAVLSERILHGEFCHFIASPDEKSFLIQTESAAFFYNMTQDGGVFEKRKIAVFSKDQHHKTMAWLKTGVVVYLGNEGIMQINPSNSSPTNAPHSLLQLPHDLLPQLTCFSDIGDSFSFFNKTDCVVMQPLANKPSDNLVVADLKDVSLDHLPKAVRKEASTLYNDLSTQKKQYEHGLETNISKSSMALSPASINERTLAQKKIATLTTQCQILEALNDEFKSSSSPSPQECVRNVKRKFPILAERQSFWKKSHTPLQELCRAIKKLPPVSKKHDNSNRRSFVNRAG